MTESHDNSVAQQAPTASDCKFVIDVAAVCSPRIEALPGAILMKSVPPVVGLMRTLQYSTPHGITVTRTMSKAGYRKGLRHLLRELDTCRGIYLSSGYEFPGRYSRWDLASTRPPVEILAFDRRVEFRPLNTRGEMLNQMLAAVLRDHPHWDSFGLENGGVVAGALKPLPKLFPEEERSKQPSVFSILRVLIQELARLTHRLHRAHCFHKDLYLCHFYIPEQFIRRTPASFKSL